MERNARLKEIIIVFLKLGAIGFGGPAAHIAMMEKEVVRKRKWMSHEHFLDLIGATNLIPGPNSTEMTMHCGYERGGWKGLTAAGISFILPAVVITSVLAWLYYNYGQLTAVKPFLYGIKPAVIAIIISAVFPLAKKAVKNVTLATLGILTLAACLLGVNEITALFGCGAIALLLYAVQKRHTLNSIVPFLALQQAITDTGSLKIFWIFLKVGALLYGSGYVLVGFLDAELVAKGLLSKQQLIDAVAVGQFTPGPVSSTATFVGWQMDGLSGAVMATLGIFLPSFVFVLLLNPLIVRIRKSKALSAFLDAVNVASVAIIVSVCISMGREAVTDWRTVIIAIISLGALFIFKNLNSAFVVIGASALGYVLYLL